MKTSSAGVRLRLRGIGRLALWALVALLLFRGVGVVVSDPAGEAAPAASAAGARSLDEASAAFAVRFAHAYFADPSMRSLAAYFTEGATPPATPASSGQSVAQAEVAGTRRLGDGRAIVTVACELLGGRVQFLAVPIVRDTAGKVAALGAPSLVAAPEVAEVDAERSQPLSGADAGPIGELVDKFLAAYVSTTHPTDLSYYIAPGITIEPLGGLRLIGAPNTSQVGGEGVKRSVLAAVHVRDEASGVTYPLSYRLELVKRERWYVTAVEGALR